MAQLSQDDVRHIAKLCRLNLSDEEVEKFSKELTSILEYIDRLQEVDTKDIEPLKMVTGKSNSFRKDEVHTNAPEPDAMLDTTALPIVEHQIQTPSAHG